ncbi:hypothetical protein ACU7M1_10195, partial [Burkholderia pseudomallei]
MAQAVQDGGGVRLRGGEPGRATLEEGRHDSAVHAVRRIGMGKRESYQTRRPGRGGRADSARGCGFGFGF